MARWLAYSFQVLIHHSGKHDSLQADMALALNVLHLDSEAIGSKLAGWVVS